MAEVLDQAYGIVWGIPTVILILGIGLYLSIRTGFAQLVLFPRACRNFCRRLTGKSGAGDGVSSFQALCTALAATVGTGNLAGVAGALAIGGPGAIFWMWLSALLGMMTKLAEAALAVRYRVSREGEYLGGPMQVIRLGMGNGYRWLAWLYSFFGVIAAFGVGNATQINAVITGINSCVTAFGGSVSAGSDLFLGVILALMVLLLLLGGAGRIGRAAEKLVPLAACLYLALGSLVLIFRFDAIPAALQAIVKGAFSPEAVTGGVIGSALTAMRTGISRGVFTNEAGMGTAGIAHAGANVDHPVEQGLMGIVEVFLDTVVICTMTALVILCSGVPVPYGSDAGLSLTADAFALVLGPWVRIFLAAAVCLFAFATILGWGLYGQRCAQDLLGRSVWRHFAVLQAVTVVFAAVMKTETVWILAEIVNGLMAIPNLLALGALSSELRRLIRDYKQRTGKSAGGGLLCRFQSTQTDASPLLCESSTPSRWRQRRRERRSIT